MLAPVPLLTAGRAAIGAGAWLAPHLTGRVLGVESGSAVQQRLLVRLFAVRDLALALGLQLSSDQSRRLWLQLGIACDAADGVAGLLAGREERRLMLLSGPALIGVGLGLVGLQAESSLS